MLAGLVRLLHVDVLNHASPSFQLARASDEIASGNYGYPCFRLGTKPDNEIGHLAERFNQMGSEAG